MKTTINTTVIGITENYKNALISITEKINNNNLVLKINGNEVSGSELNKVEIELYNLTKSGRKKIAKRIYNYDKHGTIKSINYMFHVMGKMGVTKDKVTVDVSHKEAEIQKVRKAYVKLRTEAEAARIAYKTIKGDFYK
jgi:hypothetical protein